MPWNLSGPQIFINGPYEIMMSQTTILIAYKQYSVWWLKRFWSIFFGYDVFKKVSLPGALRYYGETEYRLCMDLYELLLCMSLPSDTYSIQFWVRCYFSTSVDGLPFCLRNSLLSLDLHQNIIFQKCSIRVHISKFYSNVGDKVMFSIYIYICILCM